MMPQHKILLRLIFFCASLFTPHIINADNSTGIDPSTGYPIAQAMPNSKIIASSDITITPSIAMGNVPTLPSVSIPGMSGLQTAEIIGGSALGAFTAYKAIKAYRDRKATHSPEESEGDDAIEEKAKEIASQHPMTTRQRLAKLNPFTSALKANEEELALDHDALEGHTEDASLKPAAKPVQHSPAPKTLTARPYNPALAHSTHSAQPHEASSKKTPRPLKTVGLHEVGTHTPGEGNEHEPETSKGSTRIVHPQTQKKAPKGQKK